MNNKIDVKLTFLSKRMLIAYVQDQCEFNGLVPKVEIIPTGNVDGSKNIDVSVKYEKGPIISVSTNYYGVTDDIITAMGQSLRDSYYKAIRLFNEISHIQVK